MTAPLKPVGRQENLYETVANQLREAILSRALRPGQTLLVAAAASPDPRKPYEYRVVPGDSLYRIARRFGVTVADLRRWNSLSGHYLRPGQILKLYARDKVTTAL